MRVWMISYSDLHSSILCWIWLAIPWVEFGLKCESEFRVKILVQTFNLIPTVGIQPVAKLCPSCGWIHNPIPSPWIWILKWFVTPKIFQFSHVTAKTCLRRSWALIVLKHYISNSKFNVSIIDPIEARDWAFRCNFRFWLENHFWVFASNLYSRSYFTFVNENGIKILPRESLKSRSETYLNLEIQNADWACRSDVKVVT